MGISGRIAGFFLHSRLTPLVALIALMLGLFAVVVTPREEEPQIDVTMANVFVPFPGASAADVEQLVAIPAEQVLSQIQGLEHVWSVSRPGQAMITVQFKVGISRNDAVVRLHDTILSHRDWLPRELNVGEPLVRPKGIDDVPIVALDAVDHRSGAQRLRSRARGVRGRGRDQARAGHARGDHDRRSGPRDAGDPRQRASRGARRRRLRPAPRAARLEHGTSGRPRDPRQPVAAGRDRRLLRVRRGRSRAGGRGARRPRRCTSPTSRASSTARRPPSATCGTASAPREPMRRRAGPPAQCRPR